MAEDLGEQLRDLSQAIEALARASGGGGGVFSGGTPSKDGGGSFLGGRGPSLLGQVKGGLGDLAAGRAFGGGIAGLAGQAGFAAIAAGGAVAATAGGAGLINAQRGGSFQGGVFTALNKLAAGIPILGELSGAAPTSRIQSGAQGDLNGLTNQVARFGGSDAISPRVRAFLADTLVEQNRNVEQDRQRNSAAVNDRIGQASQGTFAGDLIRAIEGLTGAIRQGGSGYPQHGA